MHRTSSLLGEAQAVFLSREYNTEVASSCAFNAEVETFKDCMANRPGGETASVRSPAYTSTDDTSFVKSMIDRSYDEGWRPMQLESDVWHFVKFDLETQDDATYQCPHNDFCQQFAVHN